MIYSLLSYRLNTAIDNNKNEIQRLLPNMKGYCGTTTQHAKDSLKIEKQSKLTKNPNVTIEIFPKILTNT